MNAAEKPLAVPCPRPHPWVPLSWGLSQCSDPPNPIPLLHMDLQETTVL